jgi:hypothetical protein
MRTGWIGGGLSKMMNKKLFSNPSMSNTCLPRDVAPPLQGMRRCCASGALCFFTL